MFGYLTCYKPEMKMKDYELYQGYYCGVCHSISRRYGQLPRLILSYDAAFLAALIAGVTDEPRDMSIEHCLTHFTKKHPVIRQNAVDYAADVMIVLAYYKAEDDIADEGSVKAKMLKSTLRSSFNQIYSRRPELCKEVEKQIKELSALEKEKCDHIDKVAEPTALIMQAVVTYGYDYDEKTKRALAHLGYHLGRWIYLIDAFDDIEKDIDNGSYNPFVYGFKYAPGQSKEDFKKRIYDDSEGMLLAAMSEVSRACDLLDIKKNKGIIENIVLMGTLSQTDKALGKEDSNE